jgi:hypothetical protein
MFKILKNFDISKQHVEIDDMSKEGSSQIVVSFKEVPHGLDRYRNPKCQAPRKDL